jgi:hypothetical protein
MSALSIAHNNPLRPPTWRWQRALEIHENTGVPTTRRRDGTKGYAWITRAVSFLRQYDRCQDDRQKAVLAEQVPDIFWAYWIWSDQANPTRYSIEAHILAREDDYEVAYRVGTNHRAIKAFEALFFDVRDKLQHRSYILHTVMGPAIHRGLTEREFDLLWKLYGYFLGPYIVEALESKFSNPVWCGTPEAVGAAILDDAIGTLKLKAAVAAKTVAVNQHTQLALMEQFTKFVEVERNTDSAGKAQEQILDHISAMMTTLPFNVGGRSTIKALAGNPVQEFESTAIELTYEETMRLSVHQPIANRDILRQLTFPVTESTQRLEAPKS